MKKNMALMLAGAMAVTSIPVSVFAADATVSVATPATLNSNSNRSRSLIVSSTTSSALGYAGSDYTSKDDVNNAGYDLITSPEIAIKDVVVEGTAPAQFEITLDSAEGGFEWGGEYDDKSTAAAGKSFSDALEAEVQKLSSVKSATRAATTDIQVEKSDIDDNKIIVTLNAPGTYNIVVPVNGTVSSNAAPLVASVKPLDNNSNIVFKTVTTATVKDSQQAGDTTTSVTDTFNGKNNLEFDLQVTENYAGTFGTGKYTGGSAVGANETALIKNEVEVVTYTLTSGFEFSNTLVGTDWISVADYNTQNPKAPITVVDDYALTMTNSDVYLRVDSGAKNKLYVAYDFTTSPVSTQASSVKIKDIPVTAKSSVDYGTTCYISGKPDSNSSFAKFSNVVAGDYSDYAYTAELFEGETVPTLPAGSLGINIVEEDNKTVVEKDSDLFDDTNLIASVDEDLVEEYHETATIKFSENIADSLISDRTMTFTLPEDVSFVGFEITNPKDMASTGFVSSSTALGDIQYFVNNNGGTLNTGADYKFDDNVLELTNLNGESNKTGSFNITFYVAAPAGYTGDVDVVVSGDALGGVELDPVTVATFAPAYEIETAVNNIKAGTQATDTTDIVIKETEVGSFNDGETVYVDIDDEDTATLQNAIKIVDANVAVTAGDLSIKNIKFQTIDDRRYLTFEIAGESSEPSEITISDVVISTAYGLPETSAYPFNVRVNTDVNANAIGTTNSNPNNSIKYGSVTAPYVNVTGDANALNGATVAVTEGSTTYTVNGEEKQMDVAPFIDSASNSMMVPVRFIADGVGLTEENGGLIWSAGNKTVILRNGTDIIEFPVGANFYRINGATVYNDNNAVTQIVDGRTFVPFRTVGNALKLPVSWDADSRTATYN